jgi:16S rRNA (guanine527-N7)-methyltransferase
MAFASAADVVEHFGPLIGSGSAAKDLEGFAALLAKWQRVQNLVSRETLQDMWSRHIADSLQVLRYLRHTDLQFLDLGSGGGFPAIPLAIALKGGPQAFLLVEPNGRKASFLRTAAREFELNVSVEAARAEQVQPKGLQFDVITSRALASLPQLCDMAAPFFQPTTRALFHKGREHVEELRESALAWDFDVLVRNSETDPDGVILELSNLRRKSAR